ncbi:MAG TPA: ATP-binding protein [Cyclobacteriaceae bacterium]|nr:ATP-binding protein [Cyclobacteriaceae bacterium]
MVFKARGKVIAGFVLAIFLTVSVSAITYFSVIKLLDTVRALSAPNQKIMELNELLADIYQLDKTKGIIPQSNDSTQFVDYRLKIQDRIEDLKSLANDSVEVEKIKTISYDVNELIGVYTGLEEVKHNLINRNFSKEALRNIETKIKRKEELNRLQSLGRIRLQYEPKSPASTEGVIKPGSNKVVPEERSTAPVQAKNLPSVSVLTDEERNNMRELFGLLQVNLNRNDTMKVNNNTTASDSMLYAVRNFILNINYEEQQLRAKLATLESDLNQKNRALIENIQGIITHLQNEAVRASDSQNISAYDLTVRVTILLGALIIIGIIGSLGFIYSIITEINKAEDYSDRLEEAKKRSDHLAKAKQDFLANMSHEIRNPLHAIQGFNDALRKTELNSNQTEYVKMVGFASDTLSAIVNDILDFSKLEAGKINIEKEPFNPHKLFKSIHQFFELKSMDKEIDFQWEMDLPEEKWLLGDELRINQIINNLLTNAFKFTDKGHINVRVQFKDNALYLSIEDSGFGMSREVREKVFTQFNQGDGSITRKFGGTGLGLAIVKKLVDLQKGTIKVESKEGVGTKIDVVIPAKTTEPNVDRNAMEGHSYSIEGLNILVIDDDPIGLKFVNLLLTSKGANVTSYKGGVDFRDNFQEGDFDLALMDLQMPEVSGYQALQILRSKPGYKTIPALAITANVFAKEKEKLEEEGFDGLVLKPFKESELLLQIAKAMKLPPVNVSPATVPETPVRSQGEPYDLSDLEKFCMNDKEMLEEVVVDFYSETVQNLIDMNKALDVQDYQTIRNIAHQLSSRLGQLKIPSAQLAKQLEQELKANNTGEVAQRVWQITKEVDETLSLLAANYRLAG